MSEDEHQPFHMANDERPDSRVVQIIPANPGAGRSFKTREVSRSDSARALPGLSHIRHRPTAATSRPINAVTAMATAPPANTRSAARPADAPPTRPPTIPRKARETSAATPYRPAQIGGNVSEKG